MGEWERGREPGDNVGWSGVWRNLPEPIKATLVRTGTAIPTPPVFEHPTTALFIEGITVFGRELIRQLREEGYGSNNPG
jgi:hypothetical protein